MGRHLLALDMTSTTVKFADVAITGRPIVSGIFSIPSDVVKDGEVLQPDALAADLRTALKKARVRTKHTAFTVNSSRLILRRLDLPPLPILQLKQLLTWELQRYTPYQADTAEFDLLSLHLTPKQHTVLLAAVPKIITDSLVNALKLAGLHPSYLEPGIMALFRLIQCQYGLGIDNAVVLDLREDFTNIMVVIAGQPFIARSVQITLDQLEGEQKLMAEIQRSLDFIQTHNDSSLTWSCFFTGQKGDSSSFLSTLEQTLSIPVRGIRRHSLLNIDNILFASNLGLALGWWKTGLCSQINNS